MCVDSSLKKCMIFSTMVYCLLSINQNCTTALSENSRHPNSDDDMCPQNSQCNDSGYCQCQRGFFGDCKNRGQYIHSQNQQFQIDENIFYFIIQPTLNQYVYYQFTLCNQQSLDNDQLLNLWVDDGSLVTLNSRKALGIDKNIRVSQSCTTLMTPFFSFRIQPNGQKQQLIFGIKLKNPGNLKIKLTVLQAYLFGFDVIFKIMFILISGFVLISLGGLVYCIYKCRRYGRVRRNLNEQNCDIAFFDEYMPSKPAILKQLKEQICSVCLGQFQQNQQIRPTICGHSYHKTCLDEWCVTHLSCPICRTSFQKADLIHFHLLLTRTESAMDDQNTYKQKYIVNSQDNRKKPMV